VTRLRVSEHGRFLVTAAGAPFFYLADTAWELFNRLDREDAEFYFRERAAQGFTVIQAVVLSELGGPVEPNPYGHLPLVDNEPTQPVEAYFQHVDWVVDTAAALGLVIGMLPTWGDKWNRRSDSGPEIFTPESARFFGEFLGRRYREKPVVWILGGDRPVEGEAHLAILRAMAAGLGEGDGGRRLITFHPPTAHSSAEYVGAEPWLGFNMVQSGQGRNRPGYDLIAADYAREPVRPVLDGEPAYEDHPIDVGPVQEYLDDYDVRKAAWWAVLAGACGHTYGCHDVWQFLEPGRTPVMLARRPWREAIGLPGALQMRHLRRLVESRPPLIRIPDQRLIAAGQGEGTDHLQAARARDGSYAFIYFASGRPATIDLAVLSRPTMWAAWFDPRLGASHEIGEVPARLPREFAPPSAGPGHDWVLLLDESPREHAVMMAAAAAKTSAHHSRPCRAPAT
jgi:hypothetical protein